MRLGATGVAVALAVLVLFNWTFTSSELLTNGGFEESSAKSNTIEGWSADKGSNTAAHMSADSASHSGKLSALIETLKRDHVRWKQSIVVKPHTKYILSGWIKTENVEPSIESNQDGANIGWECFKNGQWHFAAHGLQGTNDWTQIQSLILDSEDCEIIDIVAQIGQYSGTTSGKAWFDDMTLRPAARSGCQLR